jgi:hypothetical protein
MTTVAGCTEDGTTLGRTDAPMASTPPGSDEAPTDAAPTDTGQDAADPAGDGAAAFVATVRDRLPEIAADRRDEEISGIAVQACAELAAGRPADRIVSATRSLGTLDAEATDQATARELIKLAIDKVCLDQAKRVDQF